MRGKKILTRLVYDSRDTYEGPPVYWWFCQDLFRYKSENTKEGPKDIGGTANTPPCIIVETCIKAPGCIGGHINTLSGIKMKVCMKVARVLVVPPTPPLATVDMKIKNICGFRGIGGTANTPSDMKDETCLRS
jgi:hypothetical protein